MRLKVAGVLCLIGGPILAYLGYSEKTKLAKIEAEGKTVEGFISGGEEKSGRRGSKSYHLDVQYAPEGRPPMTKRFKVTSTFLNSVTGGGGNTIRNDRCQVRYLPSDVNEAIIVGGSDDNTLMFPIGLVLAAVGVGMIVWVVVAARKAAA